MTTCLTEIVRDLETEAPPELGHRFEPDEEVGPWDVPIGIIEDPDLRKLYILACEYDDAGDESADSAADAQNQRDRRRYVADARRRYGMAHLYQVIFSISVRDHFRLWARDEELAVREEWQLVRVNRPRLIAVEGIFGFPPEE